ncbi:hypothetical protein [Promicromonospora soli]
MSQPLPPPPPVFAPDAVLSFTVQGNLMTSNWIAPSLTIDGHPAELPITGTRQIPIMSGRHHLRVHSQWLRQYGHAALDIEIAPGENLQVFYAPPHQNFFNEGSMGLSPQPRKGRGYFIATWTVIGLLLLVALGLFAGLSVTILTMLLGG